MGLKEMIKISIKNKEAMYYDKVDENESYNDVLTRYRKAFNILKRKIGVDKND